MAENENPLQVKEIVQYPEGDVCVEFECGCFSDSDTYQPHLNNIDCTEDPKHDDGRG